jgi:hypothetical protein
MILFATILVLKTLGYKIGFIWYLLALTELCRLKIDKFNIIGVSDKIKDETIKDQQETIHKLQQECIDKSNTIDALRYRYSGIVTEEDIIYDK